jgi:hypothetical protein
MTKVTTKNAIVYLFFKDTHKQQILSYSFGPKLYGNFVFLVSVNLNNFTKFLNYWTKNQQFFWCHIFIYKNIEIK